MLLTDYIAAVSIMSIASDNKYKTSVRLILIAAIFILGLWLSYEIVSVLFLFFFAVVLMLILNAPTMWLVSKKVPRTAAALIVFTALLLFLFLIGWLVIPKILEQVTTLVGNLPNYFEDLKNQLAASLKDYPSLQAKVLENANLEEHFPSTRRVVAGLSRFSFSVIGIIFLLIIFFSIVAYMLINPAPLIATYLICFAKEKRQKAAEALAKASTMMVGWMWANFLVGFIEAIAVFFFLKYMGVPGVWVWAGLALFGEMIPRLGLYIMAVPPTIIALSIDPVTAIWVFVFYLVLTELMGDFVMPRVRASTMDLHPVSTLFVMLAMGTAFGLTGALIATPLTAFIKAYYETFYLPTADTENIEHQVDVVLKRKIE
jgi:predicted PurR-regulated permease PerM